MTQEDFAQLRSIVREEIETEVKSLHGKLLLANLETKEKLSHIADRLKTVEIDTGKTRETDTVLAQKFDDSQVEMGGLLRDILDTVSTHHTNLESRVSRIEEHLDLPKPQQFFPSLFRPTMGCIGPSHAK